MLRRLQSVDEYMDFVHEINGDPEFSDPMLGSLEQIQSHLLDAPGKPSNRIWGVFEDDNMIGLFVFLVLEEETYIEMLVGLSRSLEAYDEMFSFLKETYTGYQADFVFNPHNHLLYKLLQREKAEFEKQQQKMVLQEPVPYQSGHQIELYGPEYREQYVSLHSEDGYWTAQKVIDTQDRFRILLAIEQGEVVGYMDVTHTFEENEPYDMYVKEEYRGKGFEKAMLARAVALNQPKGMMLLAETDQNEEIAMYESLGFVRADGQDSVTAHVLL